MKPVLPSLLLLIALGSPGAPALAEDASGTQAPQPRPVASEIVDLSSATRPSYVGVVAARTQTDLAFPVIGTMASRPVDLGDQVAQGDIIARLDPEDLEADLRAAEAGVLVASAQFKSARDAEQRARDLVARGVDADVRLEDAARQLAAAQARLDQAIAARARAADIRSYATLSAPQDGIITQVFAEPGSTLDAGAPVVTLAGTNAREIILDLTEQDVAALDIGATFTAYLVAGPDITARATLARIDPMAERSTRTRRLRLTLEDAPPGFRLGALVQVSVMATSQASLSIPRAALLDPDTAPAVWLIDRTTDTVHRQSVTPGAAYGARLRITDGLTAGDEIVVKGIHSLKDGQIVGPRVTQ